MSLSFDGHAVPFPDSACPLDPPEVVSAVTRGHGTRVPPTRKGRVATAAQWASGFVVHSVCGEVDNTVPTLIESIRDWLYALADANGTRKASWHATLDIDASVIQSADSNFRCWHACQVNPYTHSLELVETANHKLTTPQLAAFVRYMDLWTRMTGIPRIIPWRNGAPYMGMLSRALVAHGAGRALNGIYGHCNVWYLSTKTGRLEPYRGPRDPSEYPFRALADPASVGVEGPGYLKLDVEAGEDLAYLKELQHSLGVDPDGIFGPASRRKLRERNPWGVLVARPGDESPPPPWWT